MSFPVPDSAEFRRIAALTRRVWTREQAQAAADAWTPRLLNARGLAEHNRIMSLPEAQRSPALEASGKQRMPLSLNWKQGCAIADFLQVGGLFFIAPVGTGKTLFSWVAALVSQRAFNTRRPWLVVSGSGKDQTHSDFAKLAEYWQAASPSPRVHTYQALGQPQGAFALCDCSLCTNDTTEEPVTALTRPDLLMLDESDLSRNPSAAVTKRISRLIVNHPETRVICMTGTGMRHSIRNFTHHLAWTHKLQSPAPMSWKVREDWCQALDVKMREPAGRRRPGVLLQFCDEREQGLDETEAARRGYARRLAETPGVVIIDEPSCKEDIHIRLLEAPRDAALEEQFHRVNKLGTTPDGFELKNPFDKLRFKTQLGCGFWSRWDPRPPQWWLDRRSAWGTFVAEKMDDRARRGQRPLDSEGAVAAKFRDEPVYLAWKEAKAAYTPNVENVAVSLSVLAFAAEWIRVNTPALVWVQHRWVGETLSQMSGVPYFHSKGKTTQGKSIDDHDPSKSAIVSVNANRRQRNLQHWNRCLSVAPESSGEREEQRIGRVHRQGQTDTVYLDVLLSCGENVRAVQSAAAEADGVEQQMTTTQKLLTASWDWSLVGSYVRNPYELGTNNDDKYLRARWLS